MKECIKEAKSIEEAIELACRELGVEREDSNFEIITLPKRGFLGLRNIPAKVRVWVEEPEPEVTRPEPKKLEPAAEKAPKRMEGEPKQKRQPAAAKEEKPARQAAPKAPKEKAPRKEAAPAREEKPAQEALKFIPSEEVDGKAKIAVGYVQDVLSAMGVKPEITVAFTENGIVLRLSGEGLGVIIGRRGETLDSLQYLTGLVTNREEGDYMRVTIDSGNYREKRERTLEKLAQKLSASAIRYGRPSTLEPMNPYERRIIHATVSKIDGVSSSSIGEEPNRRVVITPDNLKPQSGRRRDGRPGGRGGKDGGREGRSGRGRRREGFSGDRPKREVRETVKPTSTDLDREYAKELDSQPYLPPEREEKPVVRETPAPSRAPQVLKEGEDLPLYGKIDL